MTHITRSQGNFFDASVFAVDTEVETLPTPNKLRAKNRLPSDLPNDQQKRSEFVQTLRFSHKQQKTEDDHQADRHRSSLEKHDLKSNSQKGMVPVQYVKIEASTYLICNNKLRCFLETNLQSEKLLFCKEGPKMKFFKLAFAELKNPWTFHENLPNFLKFEKHMLRISVSTERTFKTVLVESDRKVFIKGVSPNTTEHQLRNYLEQFGGVQYLQITPNRLKPSNLCAVAIFASHRTMLAVLECTDHYVNDRKIEISRYINNTFKKTTDQCSNTQPSNRSNRNTNQAAVTAVASKSNSRSSAVKHSQNRQILAQNSDFGLVKNYLSAAFVSKVPDDGNYRFNICAKKLLLSL